MNNAVILVSADTEWKAIRKIYSEIDLDTSQRVESFTTIIAGWRCRFLHSGWGKIASAASTQYAIDRWAPDLLINLGTCGGFAGKIQLGEIILVEKTLVYDIQELMGDQEAHIAHYTTKIDLSWLTRPYPISVISDLLVSGDRDLLIEEIPTLFNQYHARAGDWESGAIAWVAERNQTRVLILRGVSDLVSENGSPAYGNLKSFEESSFAIIEKLTRSLPGWLKAVTS